MTLSPEARQRLAVFEAVAVKHPRLEEADRLVSAAIEAHAGYTHLLLYGPSGVGKTTLVQQITRRLRAAEPKETLEPVVFIKAHPPDQESTVRLDYYQQILKALKHQVVVKELLVNISLTAKPGRTARFAPAWLELREAVEEALERLQVQAVIVDEAQHLLSGGPHYKPVDQLDWLKSMTNRTNALHVLTGSYDLFASRNLNGQAARRGRDVHFPRYHVEVPAERNEFLGALRFLLEQAPLSCDLENLLRHHWRRLAEGSLGCVGVLRDWLVETVKTVLLAGETTLTMEALEQQTLHPAQRVRLEMEARIGEHQVAQAHAASQQQWQTLLASPGKLIALPPTRSAEMTPGGEVTAAPNPSHPSMDLLDPSHSSGNVVQKPPPGVPFERVPHRDPVGTGQFQPRTTKCPFVGRLPLAPARLIASGVRCVECPACGALRTLDTQGSSLLFPSHQERQKRPPRHETRWVRRGNTWELFSPTTKEEQ